MKKSESDQDIDLLLQASKRVSDQSFSADHTASSTIKTSTTSTRKTQKCDSSVLLVNIVSKLIYFDLVEQELSTRSMNEEMTFSDFIQNTPIPEFSQPIMLTAQLHRKIGPEGSAEFKVNIQMNHI